MQARAHPTAGSTLIVMLRDRPTEAGDHPFPHLVERTQLLARFNEWEEHAKLGAAELLEQAAEHVIVVEEVLAPARFVVLERPL